MAKKSDLELWIIEALKATGGKASLVDAARHIWDHHEADLRASGNLLYTWQYDMRWAAERLRKRGVMRNVADSARGVWELRPTQ